MTDRMLETRRLATSRSALVSFLLFASTLATPRASSAQQQIGVDIYGSQSASSVKLALPFPILGRTVPTEVVETLFYKALERDLAFSDVFSLTALPPGISTIDAAKRAGAQAWVKLEVDVVNDEFVVDARLFDVATNTSQMARRYRGPQTALTRMSHILANDLVRFFNGKPGIFLSHIAFVSTRDGQKEIYLMDYDGANQRRVTYHKTLSISPDWSADAERIAYTSFGRESSDLYIINRRGGARLKIKTGVGLNISPKFSPSGNDVAFVGSIRGNPDIYIIRDDGTNLRRLTSASSIESTPTWNPTGRQIAFTSSRTGTPQIYVMDAEGTNVRRISFEGNWNDDAAWSPSGDMLAYTSRVEGRFLIRVMNLANQESRVIAGEGSNEQPSWSPDGKWLVFSSNRTGRWQLYRVGIDGNGLTQLTTDGENNAPDWSKKLE